MGIHIRKWGNSAAVRLPAAALEKAGLHVDDAVEVREDGGRIVIEPVRAAVDLDAMIAGITAQNRHDETDWGSPQGNEPW